MHSLFSQRKTFRLTVATTVAAAVLSCGIGKSGPGWRCLAPGSGPRIKAQEDEIQEDKREGGEVGGGSFRSLGAILPPCSYIP